MLGSKPKRLRFVVGSALLVSAPIAIGCEDTEPPNVNTAYIEPPPNPVGEQPPTMEGVGVPLPVTEEVPDPPTNPAHVEEPAPELEGSSALEGRANPVPEDAPPPEPTHEIGEPGMLEGRVNTAHTPTPPPEEPPSLMISANPVARPEPPPQERPRFAPNPGPDRRDPPSD